MGSRRAWLAVMCATTALFALRVAGQAIQHWQPQAWLPPFGSWQGSTIGYHALLAAQLAILAAMAWTCFAAASGRLQPARAHYKWFALLGGAYMAGSIARPLVGLALPGASPWFSAHISSAFHIVLASFVLALGWWHASHRTTARFA